MIRLGMKNYNLILLEKLLKNDQQNFKSDLNETEKETKNTDQKSKKTLSTILICFTMQGRRLLNFIMIILQWCVKQKLKQQDLNY